MDWPELEEGSSHSSSHTLFKLYNFRPSLFIVLEFAWFVDFERGFWFVLQVNTRQQTERDVKKEKRKLGTFQQMCQVLLSISFFEFCFSTVFEMIFFLENYD